MRGRNRAVVVVVCLLCFAGGCTGVTGPADPSTPSPTVSPTEDPVGTADLPYDLRVRNDGDSAATVEVTVTDERTGEQVFSEEVSLGPDERADHDLSFVEAGNYTVETTVGGTTHEYVWELDRVPPSHEVIVTVEDGEVTYLRSSA